MRASTCRSCADIIGPVTREFAQKSGSPAWIRTTINVIPLKSVSYRFQKGQDCLVGREILPLAQYRLSKSVTSRPLL